MLRRIFISSSGKDREAAGQVDVENRRIDASNFMNQTGLKPAERVSKVNGAHPNEITFTSGAMGSDDMTIKYLPFSIVSGWPGAKIRTRPWSAEALNRSTHKNGAATSLINLELLQKEIRPHTALISIMTVNNEIRVIQQMEEIRKLYRKHAVFFHTKGMQAMGKIPVNVGKCNVDWMSISGTKLYRTKRIATCYIRCGLKVRIN
ncbi:pyridoxal phosphate-dependent transferase [Tuber brumale]|nr:pyridoxal phosphate-dependent transferase [Tuber brumale]